MSVLKICHLTSAHPDGDVRIFHKECVSLYEAGFDVTLIVPNTQTRIEKGVKIISFPPPHKSRLQRMTKTVNKVLQLALEVDADVYQFHDPELLRIAKKLKAKGKKVIYDVHEDLPRQILSKPYLNKGIRKILSKQIERYENKVASCLDAIVTATPHIRDRFLEINSNTIDINNFPILQELLIESNYSEKSGNEICYVGGLTRVRGIVDIIKALNETDAQLLLAGQFLEDGLEKEVSALPGWNSVKYLGFLKRDEIRNTYQKSKLGLVTLHPIINYIDALPVKMFEYMAAGLPVIASKFPLWESIITENQAGICVDPKNPVAIAEAINYILYHPDEAKNMGENGRKMVIEKYNWDIEKKKLINLYQNL